MPKLFEEYWIKIVFPFPKSLSVELQRDLSMVIVSSIFMDDYLCLYHEYLEFINIQMEGDDQLTTPELQESFREEFNFNPESTIARVRRNLWMD